ncbi:LLM class F420-dependent oxidoreductase [Nocardia sp. BMG111209]|uniref:LLM class F420-dependent oxidoreductase n=1 Tax=Nocardia sp. BMG111209 TaxID=1160137 RepID=UPI0003789D9A|nr:LLM class F420-dependent oxidoreductase [Nocardia sp. BMG111209]
MKFSLYLPTGLGHDFAGYSDPVAAYETIAELAGAAEESGYETVWVADHFVPFPAAPDYMFESWTTLTALAGRTSRIRVGQMVTGNNYRNPALQAKMASTLDVVSRGRLTFGIGAGWYEDEYTAYGYRFDDARTRLRQLDEAAHIIRSLWTQPETSFEGEHYRVHKALNEPKGVQRPHIPLLIAGSGEKVTLKLVARHADACNVQVSPEELVRKYGILESHCAAIGRDYHSITRTSSSYCIIADTDAEARAQVPPWAPMVFPGELADYGLIGSPDTVRERIAAYEAAGVDELLISFHESLDPGAVRDFAKEFIRS